VLAIYKQALLDSVVSEIGPSTILDVGCGDMVVSAGLPDQGYTGVDVSPAVIQANSAVYPQRRFICGDFTSLGLERHDIVLCLDVLIHIPRRADYLELVAKCVRTAGVMGVIAAYDEAPATSSDITFYHEPISQTLRAAGAVDIRQIGAYNQVRVFQFRTESDARSGAVRVARPVFLVGAMRSGTTLLADMLGASPHVAHCPFELKDVWSYAGGIPMASPKTRDHDCPECRAKDALPDMRERLIEAFEERIRAVPEKSGDAVLLNKNPHLCNKLELVMALFPDARIIWIYRHLPQVVASLKRLFADVYQRQKTRHWWPMSMPSVRNRCWNAIHFDEVLENIPTSRIFPEGDVYFLAEYWLESNRAVAEFSSGSLGTKCFSVAEESLIASPEAQLAHVSGFLQLPFFQFEHHTLDKRRNDIWKDTLDDGERKSLLCFVEERGDEIDRVFPGERRARLYLDQLKHL
jgi:SAM-dependent methyltransferase